MESWVGHIAHVRAEHRHLGRWRQRLCANPPPAERPATLPSILVQHTPSLAAVWRLLHVLGKHQAKTREGRRYAAGDLSLLAQFPSPRQGCEACTIGDISVYACKALCAALRPTNLRGVARCTFLLCVAAGPELLSKHNIITPMDSLAITK